MSALLATLRGDDVIFGINTPTTTMANTLRLHRSGSSIVRQVATAQPSLPAWITSYRAEDQAILLVLANESKESCPDPVNWIEWYAQKYAGQIYAVQVWNEPDGPHGGTSAPLDPVVLNEYIRRTRASFRLYNHECLIVGPGLITGQPQYVTNIQTQYLDALAVHPYWKPAAELRGFLDGYHAYAPRLPIWLTEFDLRQDFVVEASRIPFVGAAIPYCWKRWEQWPHALVDEAEGLLPLYAVFQETAKEVRMPEFKFGNKAYADAHKALVGAPLENEEYFSANASIQLAEGGVFFYSKKANKTQFIPNADNKVAFPKA